MAKAVFGSAASERRPTPVPIASLGEGPFGQVGLLGPPLHPRGMRAPFGRLRQKIPSPTKKPTDGFALRGGRTSGNTLPK
eukprot:9204296-Alexandrium_andersonii.AAC.1